MDTTLWPADWPHDAPDSPMSPEEAHLTLERHVMCNGGTCPRKAAAFAVLAAGRIGS